MARVASFAISGVMCPCSSTDRENIRSAISTARKKTDERELYNITSHQLNISPDPTTGLLTVDAVGTGFLRLTRKAMMALWEASEEYTAGRADLG